MCSTKTSGVILIFGYLYNNFNFFKTHFLQAPEWLHKALHGATVDGISPELAFITGICTVVALVLVVLYTANHMVAVCANAQGLKARIGELDRLEFKARNELLILKREINEGKLNSSMNSVSIFFYLMFRAFYGHFV